jgi:hypothetical protein
MFYWPLLKRNIYTYIPLYKLQGVKMLNFSGELSFGHRVISFSVPNDTSTVALTGSTKGQLYAYLFDAKQQLRANLMLEKDPTEVVISQQNASLGGLAGEIEVGEWQLHIYNLDGEDSAPKLIAYNVDVTFDCEPKTLDVATSTSLTKNSDIIFDYSRMMKPESAWYRGDLHAHTMLSDGNNTLEAAAKIIEQQELDFFFLTDHNICHPELPVSERTLILPSMEVTTGKGHFNVHGPRRALDMFNADYSAAALIEQGLTLVAPEDCNISINHPTMKPWHWTYNEMLLSRVNTLEVCCDPTWPTSPIATEGALKILSAMWNAGHRIAAVGGSDSHLEPHERYAKATVPSIYGDPSTFVYSHGLSGDEITAGLRRGNVYCERQCGLSFSINKGDVLPGQDVKDAAINYHIAVTDTSIPYFAELIADGQCIAQYALSSESIEFDVDMSKYAWVRVDIRRGEMDSEKVSRQENFEGVINCVYNGQHDSFKQPSVKTWGDLMATMPAATA